MEHDDIVPGLIEEIKKNFEAGQIRSGPLKDLLKKLQEGKADYLDAHAFAVELGELLSEAFRGSITADRLPDGRMYYNIARRLLDELLSTNYEIISEYSVSVQELVNKGAKIGLRAQKAPLPKDRIDGLVNRLASEDNFGEISWILGDPVVTFGQAVVDDTLKANVDLQGSAGLKPTITRTLHGQACDWCKGLAGTYEYPDVPDEVYKRHSNCHCTLDYKQNKSKAQNVWSKVWR